jgi:hypothetical protein
MTQDVLCIVYCDGHGTKILSHLGGQGNHDMFVPFKLLSRLTRKPRFLLVQFKLLQLQA